jgi:hypothetical protein
MKRILALAAALTGLVVVAAAASAAPRNGTLVIRHQLRGCHTWSLNGGAFKATQTIHLARGGSLLVVNNDIMPHQLVKTSGPAISVKLVKAGNMGMGMSMAGRGMMSHMGATVKVTFHSAGVYRVTTRAGEDYMEGMKTIGEDYVLRATVVVS